MYLFIYFFYVSRTSALRIRRSGQVRCTGHPLPRHTTHNNNCIIICQCNIKCYKCYSNRTQSKYTPSRPHIGRLVGFAESKGRFRSSPTAVVLCLYYYNDTVVHCLLTYNIYICISTYNLYNGSNTRCTRRTTKAYLISPVHTAAPEVAQLAVRYYIIIIKYYV